MESYSYGSLKPAVYTDLYQYRVIHSSDTTV
jgi:hypothetical protein